MPVGKIASTNFVLGQAFGLRCCVEADFVHSILGKISAKSEDRGDKEDVGYIKASLVQFGDAMDHGISTERLGDGIDGNIAEYWELLFDLDTGCWKEEVRDEYEASVWPKENQLDLRRPERWLEAPLAWPAAASVRTLPCHRFPAQNRSGSRSFSNSPPLAR